MMQVRFLPGAWFTFPSCLHPQQEEEKAKEDKKETRERESFFDIWFNWDVVINTSLDIYGSGTGTGTASNIVLELAKGQV